MYHLFQSVTAFVSFYKSGENDSEGGRPPHDSGGSSEADAGFFAIHEESFSDRTAWTVAGDTGTDVSGAVLPPDLPAGTRKLGLYPGIPFRTGGGFYDRV